MMARSGPAMEKIFDVMEYKPKIRNDTGTVFEELKGDIEFKSVSFRYPLEPDIEVLKKVSFKIKQGDYVAFVGKSGSGKSSVIKLIERFYDAYEGSVIIGGKHV